jgi:hypothetical protein
MVSHKPSALSHDVIRLWRVRKNHTWIDAQLTSGPAAIELRFFLDGEPIFSRQFSTRALATGDAQRRLRDLERAGWTTHW